MVRVTLSKELNDLWAADEELAEMTDEDIIELILEDIFDFTDGAAWAVKRK